MAIRIDTPLLTAELRHTNRLLAAINETLCKIVEGGGEDQQSEVDAAVARLKANNDALDQVVASIRLKE